jgi:hypothetical protein
MITAVETLLLVIATVGSAVFLWAYTANNRWWSGKNGPSRAGRALVGQGTVILLLLGYASLKRVFGWPTIPGVQLSLYALTAAMEVGVAIAFVRERRMWRRRGQRRHDERATVPTEEEHSQ